MAHPRDVRIAELQAQMEAAKAEIAQLKADEQIEISEEKALNFKAAAENKKTAIDLEGNRDSEGNLIRGDAMNLSGVEVEEKEDKGSIKDVTDKRPMNFAAAASEEEINNMSTQEMIDADIPVQESKVLEVEDDEEEIITEKQIAEPEQEGRIADESEEDDEGRRKATEIENLRGEKPGWEMAKDGNYWSVNEKDDYWKTEEGYEEAINLYGDKPSWLKAQDVGTLVYNPSTGEYEEVEQEEFVDLKPYKKRISL